MADALDSKSSGLRPVWVQLPPPVLPQKNMQRKVSLPKGFPLLFRALRLFGGRL